MKKAVRIAIALGLLAMEGLFAQEELSDFDSLFEAPIEDVTEAPPPEETKVDHTAAFNVQDRLGITGSFSATGGVGLGWVEYDDSQQLISNVNGSFLALSELALAMDARPDPDLRIHGGFSVSLQPSSGNYSWSSIAVDELFCDYTLLGKALFRFGKHTIAWGQGRLYTPGNLMAGSENGTAFRVSFPTVLSGVSFVTLAQQDFFANPAAPSVTEFAYGALADAVVGNLRTSFGLRYRKAEGYQALSSLKMNIIGTDILCDAIGRYDAEETVSATTLLGFYREWKDITIYGEWQRDFTETQNSDAVGAAISYNNVGGSSVDIGVKWLHAVESISGAVAFAVSWEPFKFMRTTVALPLVYGNPGRYDILDEDMPLTQRRSLVLLAKISASF